MTPRAAEQFAAAMVAGSTGAGDPGADFPQLVTELEAAERAAGDGPDAVLLQTVRNKLDHLRPGGSAESAANIKRTRELVRAIAGRAKKAKKAKAKPRRKG